MSPTEKLTALAEKHTKIIVSRPMWELRINGGAELLRFLSAALDEMGVDRALANTISCYAAYQKADADCWEDFDGDKLREEELRDTKTTAWEHMEFAVEEAQSTLTTIRAVKDAGKENKL